MRIGRSPSLLVPQPKISLGLLSSRSSNPIRNTNTTTPEQTLAEAPPPPMAIAAIGAVSKTPFPLPLRRPPFLISARRRRTSSSSSPAAAAAAETLADPRAVDRPGTEGKEGGGGGTPEWKMMSTKELGIKNSMITRSTRSVLEGLRKKGYEVYLVGGCVRDLILKKVPKDFDILTTADLREVKQTFSRCEIVGKRFPICHVHINDSIVEVSSFSTFGRRTSHDLTCSSSRPPECDEHDYLRWRNCLRRDFTINGLMLDPYSSLVYDYFGGMEDLRKAKVRTVIPAHTSFQEDCARILRAIRIAARLGFRFSRETAQSLKDLATSVLRLDKGRLLMEMNYMLAYGSAEASLRLLWRFGLLEVLLPIQAAYFVSQGFRRRDKRSNMLLALFSNLDRLLAPNRPCHSSLWVGVLALHQALVIEPRDPLAIATFTLALHNGGDLSEAVNIARSINHPHDAKFPELAEPRKWENDGELVHEVRRLASSVQAALSLMTDEYSISQAMAIYPQAPYSDLVIVPLQVYLKVCRVFECVDSRGRDASFHPKRVTKINYSSLGSGSLSEVRHVLARVVFDTVYPPSLEHDTKSPA
ncbi:putative poly(A) polymerase I [Iris pallida]|uniref:Poly(A) polymerase I n=1 Tax=Iris pallida TaxID=29817 RepID=A0AAX6H9F6_IRIPA|nr:putative poly(A) polymerase I [Iris pallida]